MRNWRAYRCYLAPNSRFFQRRLFPWHFRHLVDWEEFLTPQSLHIFMNNLCSCAILFLTISVKGIFFFTQSPKGDEGLNICLFPLQLREESISIPHKPQHIYHRLSLPNTAYTGTEYNKQHTWDAETQLDLGNPFLDGRTTWRLHSAISASKAGYYVHDVKKKLHPEKHRKLT